MDFFEHVLDLIIDWTMCVTEYIGVIMLAVHVIKGAVEYIRKKPEAVVTMGQGMTSALSFLLAGEILRTVTIGSLYDIAIVAGIIALRTAIVVLIHWENKHSGHGTKPIVPTSPQDFPAPKDHADIH